MSLYAEGTNVPTGKSRAEIETLLTRYGADQFASAFEQGGAMVAFRAKGRLVRFILPLTCKEQHRYTPTRMKRTDIQTAEAWDQECRRRWRSLALLIKAKLEAVATGIMTFEEEFLPHFILPGGNTVAHEVLPAVAEAYRTGKMPALLPGIGQSSASVAGGAK